MKCLWMGFMGKWSREFSVCFRPVWTLADVSGVLGWNSGCGKERSSLRKAAGILLVPTPAALLLRIPGGHSLAQIVLSIRLFLAFSRSLGLILQERANPPGMEPSFALPMQTDIVTVLFAFRHSIAAAQLEEKLANAHKQLGQLQAQEARLQREQKKADTHKKMTEF